MSPFGARLGGFLKKNNKKKNKGKNFDFEKMEHVNYMDYNDDL